MRVAFGGEAPEVPQILGSYIPTLSVDSLRHTLPWAIAGVSLLKGVSYCVEKLCLAHLAISFSHDQRVQLVPQLRALSIDDFESYGQGTLHRLITSDMELFERWVLDGWSPVIRDGLQVIGLALTALLVSGEVGGWVLLIYPALMIPLLSLRRALKSRARGELNELRLLSQWTHELLSRLHISKMYQSDSELNTELRCVQTKLKNEQVSRAVILAITPPLTELISALAIATGLGWFLKGVADGRWQAEQLVSLFVCLIMMYPPLKNISKAHTHWLKAQEVLEYIQRLNLTHSKGTRCSIPFDKPSTFEWRNLIVRRGDVTLSAPLNVRVERGQMIRLMGANGTGKSSLIYQLLDLNPNNMGRQLYINNSLIEHPQALIAYSYASWHPQTGALPLPISQMIQLDSSTSAPHEGALLPRSSSPEHPSWLIKDLKALNDEDLLQGLSGGERQRLGLYITLMSARPLMILDEPEAHLDEESVQWLASHLKATSQCRACILITHHSLLQQVCEQTYAITAPQ